VIREFTQALSLKGYDIQMHLLDKEAAYPG
jgi:hypothetical protein